MHILFNGDSNLSGEELENPANNMSNEIARHFNATSTNLSLSGAGNDYIYDTTIDYLKSNPNPDLVVIGWTDHEREQWWYNGGFHQVNSIRVGMDPMPPEKFQGRYEFWIGNIKKHQSYMMMLGYYWHNKIINLHEMLTEKNIPHLFFNTFSPFTFVDVDFRIGHPDDADSSPPARNDWNHTYYEPYVAMAGYTRWAKLQGYKEITPGLDHYEPKAHADWAAKMVQYLKDYKIYDSVR